MNNKNTCNTCNTEFKYYSLLKRHIEKKKGCIRTSNIDINIINNKTNITPFNS